MKVLSLVSLVITCLLLLSTLICGLWIKTNNVSEVGSLNFHMYSGITSIIFCFISLLLVILLVKKKS
ncbi:MAG: hypothetical protein K0S30_1246 [Clostridia bacterium]|jgi:hypothetical protein|nr:hypothetical protein [Clostridia bacterium]